MQEIDLIAIDLDGTLLNDKKEVTKENLCTIKKVISKGIYVSFSSGRSLNNMKSFIDIVKLNGPIICYNGAKIYDNIDYNKVIYHKTLDSIDAKIIIDSVIKKNLTMIIWINDCIYCNKINDDIIHYAKISNLVPVILGDNISKYNNVINKGIDKIILYENNNILTEYENEISLHVNNTNIVFSSPRFLEFFHKEVSKGEALIRVCEYLKISNKNTMAIGDSYNDQSMLLKSKYGVAMANSPTSIKNIADYVTLSNNDSGVSYAIKNYIDL